MYQIQGIDMVYHEAIALLKNEKISDVKTKLNAKYGLRGSQLSLKMMDEHKRINGLCARNEAVEALVDNVVASGAKASGVRDIWYLLKHKIQVYQHPLQTEVEFSDAITNEIGTHLWKVFTKHDNSIYNRLGITTKRVELGSQPIVLFVEKELPDYKFIKDEILPYIYVASGQPNLFEFAQLAESLQSFDEIYLLTLTDFDPSGLTIAQVVATRLQEALSAFGDATVVHKSVELDWFSYPTYKLSSDQVKKDIWNYGDFGVELNAIPISDRQDAIANTLDDVIDLEIFESLAINRRTQIEFDKALDASEEYQDAVAEMNRIVDEIRDEVVNSVYDFDTNRFNGFSTTSTIVSMSERVS